MHIPFLDQAELHRAEIGEQDFNRIRKASLAWADETSISWIEYMGITEDSKGKRVQLNQHQFCKRIGLQINSKDIIKTGKRLRRLFRPHQFSAYMTLAITTLSAEELDPVTYDGLSFINEDLLEPFFSISAPSNNNALTASQITRAAKAGRYNLTYVGYRGQLKGHAIAVPASTFPGNWELAVPQNSWKHEIALSNDSPSFLALEPVFPKRFPKFDIQSLINMPWVTIDQAQSWINAYNTKLLDAISNTDDNPLAIIDDWTDPQDADSTLNWWLGDYLARGGRLHWFNTTVNAMINTTRKHLESMADRCRLPFPGWYLYIAPLPPFIAKIPHASAIVSLDNATLWVEPDHYRAHMTALGGCDADDAVWVLPYGDYSRILAWRSPNQAGEYIICNLSSIYHWSTPYHPCPKTALPNTTQPSIEDIEDHLITPILDQNVDYLSTLTKVVHKNHYTTHNVISAHIKLRSNAGVLGSYCNILMMKTALTGQYTSVLPAPLEDVIDGTVKSPRDLTPVRKWIEDQKPQLLMAVEYLPYILRQRLNSDLPDFNNLGTIDTIQSSLYTMRPTLDDLLDRLTATICMPSVLLPFLDKDSYPHLVEPARKLSQAWALAYQQGNQQFRHSDDQRSLAAHFADAEVSRRLAQLDPTETPLIALYSFVNSEAAGKQNNWLTREAMWPTLRQGLINAGLLGELTWTQYGLFVSYAENHLEPQTPNESNRTIKANGVWFNLLKQYHINKDQAPPLVMSDVPERARTIAKDRARETAADFVNKHLRVIEDEADRLQIWTVYPETSGELHYLLGYVDKKTPIKTGIYNVVSCLPATDGNWYVTLA